MQVPPKISDLSAIDNFFLLLLITDCLSSNIDCTICRCNLNTNSLHNQDKGIDSIISTGTCGHAFHIECIEPWINKNNYCPICYNKWKPTN